MTYYGWYGRVVRMSEKIEAFTKLIEAIDVYSHSCEDLYNELVIVVPKESDEYLKKKNEFIKTVTHTVHFIDTAVKTSGDGDFDGVRDALSPAVDYMKEVKEKLLTLRRGLYE